MHLSEFIDIEMHILHGARQPQDGSTIRTRLQRPQVLLQKVGLRQHVSREKTLERVNMKNNRIRLIEVSFLK